MSFVSRNGFPGLFQPLGLRARIAVWTAAMLGAALVAAFAWSHHNLRTILERKSDDLLAGNMGELASVIRESPATSVQAKLADEIRREVVAHGEEGLVVVARRGGTTIVAPRSAVSDELATLLQARRRSGIHTLLLPRAAKSYRVVSSEVGIAGDESYWLDIGHDLSATEKLLADFDRHLAAGGILFLVAGESPCGWKRPARPRD